MSDYAARLGDAMRRIRGAANVLPRPSDVCVLVAPPLGRARVWAAFHLPLTWLHAAGWNCDFFENGRRTGVSHREHERWVGIASRTAYQRLLRTGARVTGRVRRRDVEAALLDPEVRAIILTAPDVLPFSAPMRVELSAAIETCAAWIEGLDGATPFDVAQQRACARQFPSESESESESELDSESEGEKRE